MRVLIGFNWLVIGSNCGLFEYSNEPSYTIKSRKFTDQLRGYQHFKIFAPWNYLGSDIFRVLVCLTQRPCLIPIQRI
jgi:hypothetical protein